MSQHLTHHPAPGIGNLMPGWWTLPQNPIVPARYQARMGELLPGTFVVPQNPIVKTLSTGVNSASMGCASCQYRSANMGLGNLGYFDTMTPSTWGWMEWATIGVGAVLVLSMMRPGKTEYKAAVTSAKETYRKAIAGARAKYPRVAGRVKRAYRAAAEAI